MSTNERRVRRGSLAMLATVAITTTGLAVPYLAQAAEPTHDRVVSANPENFTPNVEDGQVNAMVQIGNRIIAVGNFTRVTPTGGATVTRNRIFAFNATTGALDNTFLPAVDNTINDIADAGDGTVYIGGNFTSVNSAARTQRVARINATTGAVVTAFQSPNPNKNVTDIQLINSRLYLGGAFTTVGGQPRTQLAALNPTTGADTNTVALTFGGTWNGGSTTIKHFDISDNGATLVAVGNFRTVNGQSRLQIMMANLSGASAMLSGWATRATRPTAPRRSTPTCATSTSLRPTTTSWSWPPVPHRAARTQERSAIPPRAGRSVRPVLARTRAGSTTAVATP